MTVQELIIELSKYPRDMKISRVNSVFENVGGELTITHKDTPEEIELADKFEYYGLFLTEESKAKLKAWLINSNYQPEILKSKKEYLDHCTLLHWAQEEEYNYLMEEDLKFMLAVQVKNMCLEIDGIGISDKALAFRCNLSEELCANKIPHITICTFNGGKPVDSNKITEWKDIKPITVEAKLERR